MQLVRSPHRTQDQEQEYVWGSLRGQGVTVGEKEELEDGCVSLLDQQVGSRAAGGWHQEVTDVNY